MVKLLLKKAAFQCEWLECECECRAIKEGEPREAVRAAVCLEMNDWNGGD